MKLTESRLRSIIREELNLLQEGTWSTPNTVQKARKLARAMESPIGAEEFKDNYSNVLGDDELYDKLSSYQRGKDVRPAIANHIRFNILGELDRFLVDFDPEAIEILRNIVNKR